MHSVCHCSLPVWRRSFLKKGTPVTYFCPALDPPLGGSGRKTTTLVGPWVLHAYQVSSKSIKRFWRRSRKCEKFTPDGRRRTTTDDGRTDDGRCAMTIAHSSLRLRWAKKKTTSKSIYKPTYRDQGPTFLPGGVAIKFIAPNYNNFSFQNIKWHPHDNAATPQICKRAKFKCLYESRQTVRGDWARRLSLLLRFGQLK